MDLGTIVQRLIQMLDDDDGFLVQVGARAQFDPSLFGELVTLLQTYREVLGDEPDINRHIAGCLYALDSALMGLANHYLNIKHPDARAVSQAHADIIDLILELMPS